MLGSFNWGVTFQLHRNPDWIRLPTCLGTSVVFSQLLTSEYTGKFAILSLGTVTRCLSRGAPLAGDSARAVYTVELAEAAEGEETRQRDLEASGDLGGLTRVIPWVVGHFLGGAVTAKGISAFQWLPLP